MDDSSFSFESSFPVLYEHTLKYQGVDDQHMRNLAGEIPVLVC